jgi:lysine-specific demethylase/histidyl-hydroxylase NO66
VIVSNTRGSAGASGTALARCVGAHEADFADRYWSRKPLLNKAPLTEADAKGAGFSDLFGPAAVDELVSRRGLRTPFARMAKDGSVVATSAFTRSGGVGATIGDQLADDKILAQVASGATLVLQALHRTWPPLVDFGCLLAAELGHPVQINAYVTPPQNQGFAAHYDTHDVFVLQISGRKHWTIHEPVLTDPLPSQQWQQYRGEVAARAAEPPLLQATLEPGDSLYLPRGYLHSATADSELSIHLTVGIHPVTRHAVLTHALAELMKRPDLRTSLPMAVDLSQPETMAAELAAATEALVAALQDAPHDLLTAVTGRVGSDLDHDMRAAPISPLAQLAAITELTGDRRLRLRPGLRVAVQPHGDGVTLSALDKQITLAAAMLPAVKAILGGAEFAPAELPGLDAAEQLVLTRRLLREALLVPAGEPAAGR